MDIEVTDINMYKGNMRDAQYEDFLLARFAGRQQLLSGATLRLADGFKVV